MRLLDLVVAGLGSMTIPRVVGRAFDTRDPEILIHLVAGTIAGSVVVFGAIDMRCNREGYDRASR